MWACGAMAARRVCIAEAGGSNPPESINPDYEKLDFLEFKRAKKQEKIGWLKCFCENLNSNELKVLRRCLNLINPIN